MEYSQENNKQKINKIHNNLHKIYNKLSQNSQYTFTRFRIHLRLEAEASEQEQASVAAAGPP